MSTVTSKLRRVKGDLWNTVVYKLTIQLLWRVALLGLNGCFENVSPIRKSIYITRCLSYTSWCQLVLIYIRPLSSPLQWSMTALVSHGCRVMEGDFTFDWTGGGMLLEQSVVRLRVWWRLSNPWQQGPTALNPSPQPIPQWLLGNAHGWGKWWSSTHLCVLLVKAYF